MSNQRGITNAHRPEFNQHTDQPQVRGAAGIRYYQGPQKITEAGVETATGEQQVPLEEVYQVVQGEGTVATSLLLVCQFVGEGRFVLIYHLLVLYQGDIQLSDVQVEYLDIEDPTRVFPCVFGEYPLSLFVHDLIIRGQHKVQELYCENRQGLMNNHQLLHGLWGQLILLQTQLNLNGLE